MTTEKTRRGQVTRPLILQTAKLMLLLQEGLYNSQQLAEGSGMNRNTVQLYCRALHQVGAIHIASRKADVRGGHTILIYKMGSGTDAPPQPKTKKTNNLLRDARRRQAREHDAGIPKPTWHFENPFISNAV